MPEDKVIITPATGKIVFQVYDTGTSSLKEVGSIDAEPQDGGNTADQIVIDKAKMINGELNGGTY
jgi:hypothetical protein